MSLSKFLRVLFISFVLWFPAFVISYIIWSAIWAGFSSGRLYELSDPFIFLTDFIPPFVNPHYDHFLNGFTEQRVMLLWYFFVIALLLTTYPLFRIIKKFVRGLIKEFSLA